MKKQQETDPFVQQLRLFLRDKVLPKERYRNIVKHYGPYCFDKEGVTMIQFKRPNFPTRDLIVAPADRIADIIAESHGSLLGGHDSVDKTAQRILQHYWFPGVYSEN